MKTNKANFLLIRLPVELREQLKKIAYIEGESESTIVRRAIRKEIARIEIQGGNHGDNS